MRVDEPLWLIGGEATLKVSREAPTLWLIDIDDPATRARLEAVALLPGEPGLFATRNDAGERLLRRRAARLLLAAAGGCRADEVDLARSPASAPISVVPRDWHMSMAARWPHCLVGLARTRLGVDLERVEDGVSPEPDLLTARERDRLDATAGPDRSRWFARAWAAKESHAKWTGEPRLVTPALVETDEARVTSPWGETQCWRYEIGALAAAVCTGS